MLTHHGFFLNVWNSQSWTQHCYWGSWIITKEKKSRGHLCPMCLLLALQRQAPAPPGPGATCCGCQGLCWRNSTQRRVGRLCMCVPGVCVHAWRVCLCAWCVCVPGMCVCLVCVYVHDVCAWCVCVCLVCVCMFTVCMYMMYMPGMCARCVCVHMHVRVLAPHVFSCCSPVSVLASRRQFWSQTRHHLSLLPCSSILPPTGKSVVCCLF